MDTSLKQDIYEQYAVVYAGTASREATGEQVVPDSMPDVGTVVDAQGVLCVRGKDAAAGEAKVSGAVSVFALYAPADGGGLRCVEATLPVELSASSPEIDDGCVVHAVMRLVSVEARAVNSRKLALRAEVAADLRVMRREGFSVASGLADSGAPAHALIREAEITVAADAREKTFVVADEYAVPAGLAGGVRVLSRRVAASVDDVRFVTGKAVFRGRAVSELIFADEDGAARAARYETEFSQIMEVECEAEEAQPAVTLLLTGAYYDMPEYGEGAGRVQAELHFAAQCVCRERRKVSYLADVYANRTLLIPEFGAARAVLGASPVSMRQTVAGRAEPEGGGELFYAGASVGAASVEDGAVKTSVLVRLVTVEDGAYSPAKCRLSAEFTLPELADGARLEDVTVTAADVYASGADVRAVLQLDAVAVTEGSIRSVSAVAEDPEAFAAMAKKPSATLVRAGSGGDLWALARRCGSSVEAIEAANGGRREGALLVPKAR